MSNADRAKEIRKALKAAHGWTGRQISVRASNGHAVNVSIKDADIPLGIVEPIAEQWRSPSRNEFVFVSYETGVLAPLFSLLETEISAAIEGNGQVLGIFHACVTGNRLQVFRADGETGTCVAEATHCEGGAQVAACRLGRYVAAEGILSGWGE